MGVPAESGVIGLGQEVRGGAGFLELPDDGIEHRAALGGRHIPGADQEAIVDDAVIKFGNVLQFLNAARQGKSLGFLVQGPSQLSQDFMSL